MTQFEQVLEPAHKLLQNGEMRVIEGAGIYICDLQPERMASIITTFFA